ncbi:MAG: hypothetical protein ACFFG0_03630 [Candidatus Thorarchaeota archaeon]
MKKPEKKKCVECNGKGTIQLMGKDIGCLGCEMVARYNKALSDYEAWLKEFIEKWEKEFDVDIYFMTNIPNKDKEILIKTVKNITKIVKEDLLFKINKG